ncbi:bacillithiol biosynthesis cysteine-adding enzyme BshC [candidate division KSB1 bacterium]|nr:bacillithiol biosynthesis cysteine-adding enzyme BshC [candidate division KSB1 bacterium]
MSFPPEKTPGISQLVVDYLTDWEKVKKFFTGDFRNLENYRHIADNVLLTKRPFKKELTKILTEQNTNFGCERTTLENISKLSEPETLVVATGQQVGLFSGPLYTIYKALTTIKLARELSIRMRTTVLPVFYLVSEDHDFDEVKWTGYIDRDNRYKKLVYEAQNRSDRSPVSQIDLDNSISTLITQFADSIVDTEYKDEILNSLGECYKPGVKYVIAFARWFTRLFEKYGIILFDSSDSRFKPFVKDVFAKELKEQISIKVLQKAGQELTDRGYHTQISVQPDRPNVFTLKDGRHSLQLQENEYINMFSGEKYTVDVLLQHPELLSPKAALRPLVQDTLFPTVAYVGGPGEIAYWAQLKGLYKAMALQMPIVFPRAGFTLIEPKIKRHFEKFALIPEQFIIDRQGSIEKALSAYVPEDIKERFVNIQANLSHDLKLLREKIIKSEPSMKTVIEKTESGIEKQIDMMEQKVMKAVEQREQIISEQIRTISENLLPENTLQERKLNILPYLIKYGRSLLDRLYDAVDPENIEHKMMEL